MNLEVGSSRQPVDVDDWPPSHPKFNRANLSDSEFCERLLFENKELQQDLRHKSEQITAINKQHDKTIRLLRQQLDEKENLIVSLQDLLRESISRSALKLEPANTEPTYSGSSNSSEDHRNDAAVLDPSKENEIKHVDRAVSAGEVKEVTISKDATRHARDTKDVANDSTDLLNGTEKVELTSGNGSRDTKQTPTDSSQDTASNAITTPIIPLRSNRRRRNSLTSDQNPDELMTENGSADTIASSLENPKLRSKKVDSPTLSQGDFEIGVAARVEKSTPRLVELDLSTPRMHSFISQTPPTRVESGPEKNSPRQLDAILEKLSRKISESSVINSSTLNPVSPYNEDKPIFDSRSNDDQKTKLLLNSSSSNSTPSYKSRIKLPSSMKKPLDLHEYQYSKILDEDHEKQSSSEYLDSIDHLASTENNEEHEARKDDKNSNKNKTLPLISKEKPQLPKIATLHSKYDLPLTLKSPVDLSPHFNVQKVEDEAGYPFGSEKAAKTPEKFNRNIIEVEPADKQENAIYSPATSLIPLASPQAKLHTKLKNSSTSSLTKPNPNSSFHVLPSPKPEEDEILFIKPEEFYTIYLKVVSTISLNSINQSSRSGDPSCIISIHDRESNKEMWKIRKTYSQILAFDNEIRPIVEYFGLPNIPEKQLFFSTTPSKVDQRRSALQNYFNSISLLPHIPHMVLLRICRYLSLDFVNPLDDFKSGSRKEGFLLRRYKGLGTSWKIRWCEADGPFLEIYDNPGGSQIEQINLKGAQIGRQNSDSIAEDKGYRHAFLIMEGKSSKLSSSSTKHFFCAETDEQRDEWVNVLLEYNDPDLGSEVGSSSQVDLESTLLRTPQSANDYKEFDSYTHKNSTNLSINTAGLVLSNHEEEEREVKKNKKKSIFPFRSRHNEPEETNTVVSTNQDNSMQQYIDQLKLDEQIDAIFGRELIQAYNLSHHIYENRPIPSICYRCLDFLTKRGAIYEEGIFRLSGSASTIRQLKDQFNKLFDLDLFESKLRPDIHTVSGLFKTYLRELPSPIIGQNCYQHLNNVILHNNLSYATIATIFRDYFNDETNVDRVNYNTCYIIFKFLNNIIKNNQINRMNLRNVCIVFVPTLNISLEVLSTFLVDFACIFENGAPVPDHKREVLDLQIPNF